MKKLEMCKKALINEKMYDIREMQKGPNQWKDVWYSRNAKKKALINEKMDVWYSRNAKQESWSMKKWMQDIREMQNNALTDKRWMLKFAKCKIMP